MFAMAGTPPPAKIALAAASPFPLKVTGELFVGPKFDTNGHPEQITVKFVRLKTGDPPPTMTWIGPAPKGVLPATKH
jgi:hypothetical protein